MISSFSRSLEYFFLTVGQNNFGNKMPFLTKTINDYGRIFEFHFPTIKSALLTVRNYTVPQTNTWSGTFFATRYNKPTLGKITILLTEK